MKTFILFIISISTCALYSANTWAGDLNIPNTFTADTPAVAAEVNANFNAVETEVDDNDGRITINTNEINTFNTLKTTVDDNDARITINTDAIDTNSDNIAAAGDGHSLDAADGAPVDAVFVDNAGNTIISGNIAAGPGSDFIATNACSSSFTRVGLWCIDTDGSPSLIRSATTNETNSTSTDLDTMLGLPDGTVKVATVRTVLIQVSNSSSSVSWALLAPQSFGNAGSNHGYIVATLLTGQIFSGDLRAVTESTILTDGAGAIHTECAWGTASADQAKCEWRLSAYLD